MDYENTNEYVGKTNKVDGCVGELRGFKIYPNSSFMLPLKHLDNFLNIHAIREHFNVMLCFFDDDCLVTLSEVQTKTE